MTTAGGSTPSARVDRRRRAPDLESIYGVAADLFAERGYDAVTMDDLAAALGITKPTLYVHVRTKVALAAGIIEDVIRLADVGMDQALIAPGHAEQLRVLIQNWTRLNTTVGSSLRLLERGPWSLPADQIAHYDEWSARAFRRIRDVVEAGQREGDFRRDVDATVVAFMVLGVVNWTSRWFHAEGALSADEVAEQYWRIFRDATSTHLQGRGWSG